MPGKKRPKKTKKTKKTKVKKKLTAAQRRAKKANRAKYQWIFRNGKQVRVLRPRPDLIDGIPADEFIRANADPVWLKENEMWEELYAYEQRENGPSAEWDAGKVKAEEPAEPDRERGIGADDEDTRLAPAFEDDIPF